MLLRLAAYVFDAAVEDAVRRHLRTVGSVRSYQKKAELEEVKPGRFIVRSRRRVPQLTDLRLRQVALARLHIRRLHVLQRILAYKAVTQREIQHCAHC